VIINVSEGKKHYNQRNNVLRPYESCNVTSMVMALSYLGYDFPPGEYEQPEDNLRSFIESAGKNPENHYHLSECANIWMGKRVTAFSERRAGLRPPPTRRPSRSVATPLPENKNAA
jgi:hypothetical protein